MYYQTYEKQIKIEVLERELKKLIHDYEIYFKKGSEFRFLNFIGYKDSIIIRNNALNGYKLYLVKTKSFTQIAIKEYIPSGFFRNNPIPLGIFNLIFFIKFRINKEQFLNNIISSLNNTFNGYLITNN